jgi:hypothetical protein
MGTVHRTFAAGAVAMLMAACASAGGPKQMDQDGYRDAGRAEIIVQNSNWLDMNVYAVRGGSRMRLGTVTSMGRERFRLPRYMVEGIGGLQLVADPIGSRDVYSSQPIMISPGQRIEWKLENNLALSSFAVRL